MKKEMLLKLLELLLKSDAFKGAEEQFYESIREFAKKSDNNWDDQLAELLIFALRQAVDHFDGEN